MIDPPNDVTQDERYHADSDEPQKHCPVRRNRLTLPAGPATFGMSISVRSGLLWSLFF